MNPSRLGRFQILRELGKGAMGRVFLAYDPKIQRQVALKIVTAGEQFLQEARAYGRLQHPNIVMVFDVGEDKGFSFIAMEFVEGENLDTYTRPGCLLPIDRILTIIDQACGALDYAHAHHIVHRDIKPENLLLMSGDHLKITDFGLAKQPSGDLMKSGAIFGTPYYMSPEQIAGKPVDGRSDLFSLGVVLYQLLTGERPFPGDSVSTIVYRIMYETPRAPKIVNEKLPVHFNTVLERALSKDPAGRFQTGKEFLAGIEDYRKTFLKTLPAAPRPAPAAPVPARKTAPKVSPKIQPEVHAPPLLAGQPGKIGFLLLTVLACLFLFPRSFGREAGRWGENGEFQMAGIGPQAGPGTAPTELRVWVTTDPGGADLYFDGELLEEDSFLLSLGDDSEHLLIGRAGCRKAEQSVRVADRPEAITLELAPEILSIEIDSVPDGARMWLDGEALGRKTPASLDLDWCQPHEIRLEKAGFYPWKRTFAAAESQEVMRRELARPALKKIPNGYLEIPSPEGYRVEIFLGRQRIGTSGETITLPSGTYNLLLKNERHFVEKEIRVKIPGKKTVTPAADLPRLGYLTILALPSNCKIFVGERYLDIPPVVDYPIAAGEYTIRAEYLPTGETREEKIRVEAGRQHRITFRFEP